MDTTETDTRESLRTLSRALLQLQEHTGAALQQLEQRIAAQSDTLRELVDRRALDTAGDAARVAAQLLQAERVASQGLVALSTQLDDLRCAVDAVEQRQLAEVGRIDALDLQLSAQRDETDRRIDALDLQVLEHRDAVDRRLRDLTATVTEAISGQPYVDPAPSGRERNELSRVVAEHEQQVLVVEQLLRQHALAELQVLRDLLALHDEQPATVRYARAELLVHLRERELRVDALRTASLLPISLGAVLDLTHERARVLLLLAEVPAPLEVVSGRAVYLQRRDPTPTAPRDLRERVDTLVRRGDYLEQLGSLP